MEKEINKPEIWPQRPSTSLLLRIPKYWNLHTKKKPTNEPYNLVSLQKHRKHIALSAIEKKSIFCQWFYPQTKKAGPPDQMVALVVYILFVMNFSCVGRRGERVRGDVLQAARVPGAVAAALQADGHLQRLRQGLLCRSRCVLALAPFTGCGAPRNACKLWNTLWSMGVFTQHCKQHQRVCMQMFFHVLCEQGLKPNPHWMRARKFVGNSFDVACVECEHSHLQQQVPFVFARRVTLPRVQCGLGPNDLVNRLCVQAMKVNPPQPPPQNVLFGVLFNTSMGVRSVLVLSSLFSPSATVSRNGLVESCLCRHCHWCGGPPYPPGWLATPKVARDKAGRLMESCLCWRGGPPPWLAEPPWWWTPPG